MLTDQFCTYTNGISVMMIYYIDYISDSPYVLDINYMIETNLQNYMNDGIIGRSRKLLMMKSFKQTLIIILFNTLNNQLLLIASCRKEQ